MLMAAISLARGSRLIIQVPPLPRCGSHRLGVWRAGGNVGIIVCNRIRCHIACTTAEYPETLGAQRPACSLAAMSKT